MLVPTLALKSYITVDTFLTLYRISLDSISMLGLIEETMDSDGKRYKYSSRSENDGANHTALDRGLYEK